MRNIVEWIKERKKNLAVVALLLLCFVVTFGVYYKKAVMNNRVSQVKLISDMADNLPQQQLKENQIIAQNFFTAQGFDGIQLKISTSSKQMQGKFCVQLLETEKQRVVATWEDSLSSYYEYDTYDFDLNEKERISEKTEYTINVWLDGTNGEGIVFLYHSNGDGYPDGTSYIDGVEQETDVIFTVYELQENRYPFIKPMYLFMSVAFLFVGIATFYLAFIKNMRIEKIFLITVGSLGLLYMIIMPPFSSPDEPIHFGTAYKISNEILRSQVVGENGYVVMRADDANVSYGTVPTVDTYEYTLQNFGKSVKDKSMISWPHINLNSKNIITHLPGAVGISIGRIFNMGSIPLIYLGRIANMLFYLILVYFAIKITPVGKMLFCAISMTPMMLELISSYSYDAVVNGIAFLSIAYICSCIYEKEKIKVTDILILAILAALLAPCKIVYSLIFGLCIFIPKEKFDKKMYYFLSLGAIAAMIVLSNVYVNLGAVTSMSGASASSTATEERYSLMWCLQNPKGACHIFWATTQEYGKYYFITLFGGLLGWLEIKVSDWLIYLFAVVILLCVFIKSDKDIVVKKSHRFVAFLIMGGAYVLILASMFFGITPFGNGIILGVQGRYFLTILPLFSVLFMNKKVILSRKMEKYFYLGLITLNYTILCQVFTTICSR